MIKLQNDKSRSHGCKKHFFLSLSVWVCVCNFQLSESGSAWAIRAWMISQASLPYPPLKCESHSYCVPPPLIMFSNDSAKRQGIPAACHRPAQKCADGVITGAINAHHPQLFCPTCAFFCLSGKGEGGGAEWAHFSTSQRKVEMPKPLYVLLSPLILWRLGSLNALITYVVL